MSTRPKRPLSSQLFGEFLADFPLYRKLAADLPNDLVDWSRLLPQNIYRYCKSTQCKREQPFQKHFSKYLEGSKHGRADGIGIYFIVYRCRICTISELMWWVELGSSPTATADKAYYFRKVGQLPPFDLPIDRRLAKELGENDEILFKEAQICISQSFGIGACIYLRRIIENKIDQLLRIQLEKRKAEKASAQELKAIDEAITSIVFEEKLKAISSAMPERLEVEGHNPVYLMYRKLSQGIHTLNDQQCVEISQAVSSLLTNLLVELEQQRRSYVDAIKALAKRNLSEKL